MHPILFQFGPFHIFGLELGPISIYTYGLMVALGFLFAITTAIKLAKREQISEETILDLSFKIIVFSIIGARIFYILLNFSYYADTPWEIFKVYKGGLVFYGGFIAGITVVFLFARKHNLRLGQIADIFAPGLILGQAMGRIGCLFQGCCYGKETTLPWGITFPPNSLASYFFTNNHHIHPTQIYAAIAKFTIFIFLFWFYKKRKFEGQIFLLYMILYSIERFILEIFRGDLERGFLGPLSTSQFISLLLLIVGITMYYKLNNNYNKKS